MSNYIIVSCRMEKAKHREMERFSEDMERSKSWILNKAFDLWAAERRRKQGGRAA